MVSVASAFVVFLVGYTPPLHDELCCYSVRCVATGIKCSVAKAIPNARILSRGTSVSLAISCLFRAPIYDNRPVYMSQAMLHTRPCVIPRRLIPLENGGIRSRAWVSPGSLSIPRQLWNLHHCSATSYEKPLLPAIGVARLMSSRIRPGYASSGRSASASASVTALCQLPAGAWVLI